MMPAAIRPCRCKGDPPRLHGPYYLWTRKVAAKTVTVRLTAIRRGAACSGHATCVNSTAWSDGSSLNPGCVPPTRARLGPVLIEAVAPSGASELPGLSIFAHSLVKKPGGFSSRPFSSMG